MCIKCPLKNVEGNLKKTKTTPVDEPKKVHKKRGRKPKGGKIIKKINEKINADELKKPNIILQLKCSSKDLQKTRPRQRI